MVGSKSLYTRNQATSKTTKHTDAAAQMEKGTSAMSTIAPGFASAERPTLAQQAYGTMMNAQTPVPPKLQGQYANSMID